MEKFPGPEAGRQEQILSSINGRKRVGPGTQDIWKPSRGSTKGSSVWKCAHLTAHARYLVDFHNGIHKAFTFK